MIHSAVKDTLILLPISRQDIEAQDITSALGRLGMLSGDRSSAMSAEGCVSLAFSGYDDDTRPLHAIPEVRAWFQKLHAAWPYWSFFVSRTDETVGIVISFLLPGRSVPGVFAGQHGWEFDINGLQPLLLQLFAAQNDLIERMVLMAVNFRRNLAACFFGPRKCCGEPTGTSPVAGSRAGCGLMQPGGAYP